MPAFKIQSKADARRTGQRLGILRGAAPLSRLRNPLVVGLITTTLLTIIVGAHRLGWELPGVGEFAEGLECRTADLRFRLRGPIQPGPETVIVVFDDKTAAADPSLFERRSGWKRMIATIDKAGAKVIGIDAFFSAPEQLLSKDLVADVKTYLESSTAGTECSGPVELLERVLDESLGDLKLAEAIAKAGNVVLGMHVAYSGQPSGTDDPSLKKGRYGQTVPGIYEPPVMDDVFLSQAMFNKAAKALGTVTVFEDETHTVREMKMVLKYNSGLYAPLAAQLVAQYEGLSRAKMVFLGSDNTVHLGKRTIKLTKRAGFYINYRGPLQTIQTISMIDLINGQVPQDVLKDRIVLLGITQLGHDNARTPFASIFPAVELQATAVDNILRGDFIIRTPAWLDALICLGLGLVISFLFWQRLRLAVWLQLAGSLLALLVFLGVSHYLFAEKNMWFFWVGPISIFIFVCTVCLAFSYLGEGLQRRRLRHAFAHYLSDDVIHKLLDEPGALSLGGERRELTALFSDIRGFTNISEHISPEELTSLLNEYFTPMTRAVLSQGGLLDKYIGDALMAIFGAPLADPQHASHALASVLEMHAELKILQSEFSAKGVAIDIGVGVNTGEMVVGNMGSKERFDYTVVGDAVNLASRLEGITKTYGVFCLVGQGTRKMAGQQFAFREIDWVQVKGKSEVVSIYELLSGPGGSLAAYQDLPQFDAALQAYRQGDFKTAREGFQSFLKVNPDDQVTKVFVQRLADLGDQPPADWNPVVTYQTK
jgi:adenylate cyclase